MSTKYSFPFSVLWFHGQTLLNVCGSSLLTWSAEMGITLGRCFFSSRIREQQKRKRCVCSSVTKMMYIFLFLVSPSFLPPILFSPLTFNVSVVLTFLTVWPYPASDSLFIYLVYFCLRALFWFLRWFDLCTLVPLLSYSILFLVTLWAILSYHLGKWLST